jgi:hypothetical protein
MARKNTMFTIYHLMDANGHFDQNPANQQAKDQDGRPLYEGPVEYPKMFYHPMGEMRITVPAELIETPRGVKEVGEQREIIWKIARNEAEGNRLRDQGWHSSPAKAIAAAGGVAPPESAEEIIHDKDAMIRKLQRELAEARGEAEPPPPEKLKPGLSITKN